MSSGNKYADTYIKQVQQTIATAKEKLQGAKILAERLRKAGQSTLQIDSEIASIEQQISQLEEAFS